MKYFPKKLLGHEIFRYPPSPATLLHTYCTLPKCTIFFRNVILLSIYLLNLLSMIDLLLASILIFLCLLFFPNLLKSDLTNQLLNVQNIVINKVINPTGTPIAHINVMLALVTRKAIECVLKDCLFE